MKLTNLLKNSSAAITVLPSVAIAGLVGYGVYLFWPAIKAAAKVASLGVDAVNYTAESLDVAGNVFLAHPVDNILNWYSGKMHLPNDVWINRYDPSIEYDKEGNEVKFIAGQGPILGNEHDNLQWLFTYGNYGKSGDYRYW